jgi:hypothetical protein
MNRDRDMDSILTISDAVAFRELDGEAVILNMESGMYFGLDQLGTRIWQLIAEHGRLSMVSRALLDEYDVPASILDADLARLVAALVEKGLLVPGDVEPESS